MYKITIELINIKKGKNGHIYYINQDETKQEFYLRYNIGMAIETILNYITRKDDKNENK